MSLTDRDRVRVLTTTAIPSIDLGRLPEIAEIVAGSSPTRPMSRAEVIEAAADCVAIINGGELTVDATLLNAAQALKVVANTAAGYDNLHTNLMAARGVWATNTPDAYTDATADHTLALLLALVRRLPAASAYVRAGGWDRDGFEPGRWDGALLAGRVLGIVGYGRIGKAVGRRARAFGMKVIFYHPRDPGGVPLEYLLEESDVVTLHAPLTRETRHLIGSAEFLRMRRGTYFLNLSRGALVDQQALLVALDSGQLAGAGLDVAENEPVVPAELREHPNAIITPHIGGGTPESRRMARIAAAENVVAVLNGLRPPTPVNDLV